MKIIPIVPIICGAIIGFLLTQNTRLREENIELTDKWSYAQEGREYFLEVATHFQCMQVRQKDIRDCLMSIPPQT